MFIVFDKNVKKYFYEFLQSYFAKNPISDELKDCLMFSKNKFLLPDLQ